jgi:CubicO group peptidase (beta-lactamase class C family)
MQATLANWRTPPFHRWGFQHVRELIPTADIPNDPARVRALPAGNSFDFRGLNDFLKDTDTDGLLIVQRGRVVLEHYANGLTAATPHILMSVSKSMLGLLVGALDLDVGKEVTHYVPELAGTAYRGATVRQLLDMRTGVAFDEDYLATSGAIVEYRKASGWNPLGVGETPSDLKSFFGQLVEKDRDHGGHFKYTSPNSDLLGWVIENATGRRYADLVSERLWQPIGAERPAYVTLDRLGAPRCAGGMCTTLRDLARVGQMMVEGGRGIVPESWIADLERGGERAAWDAGNLTYVFPGLPLRYRGQWYVLDGETPMLFGWGIHGQHLFVDRRRELAIAKFSSQDLPIDVPRMAKTIEGIARLRREFPVR